MASNEKPVDGGNEPTDEMTISPDPESGGSGGSNLNDLMELEILREVDADGNPVEAAEEDLPLQMNPADGDPELVLVSDDDEQDRITALEEERDRLREDLLRAQADFINFRKRMEREKSDVVRRASQSLIEELLPVVDNFELALANDPEQTDPGNYRDGVRLIHKQLLDLLARQGLQEIECVGEIFDPNIHEAVAVLNDPDKENNTVVALLKKGYYLRDRLIRSPLVQVVIHEESGRDVGEKPESTETPEP